VPGQHAAHATVRANNNGIAVTLNTAQLSAAPPGSSIRARYAPGVVLRPDLSNPSLLPAGPAGAGAGRVEMPLVLAALSVLVERAVHWLPQGLTPLVTDVLQAAQQAAGAQETVRGFGWRGWHCWLSDMH